MRNQDNRHWPDDYLCSGDGVILIPVTPDTVNPQTVVAAYERTKEDGLLTLVFHREMEMDDFFLYFANPQIHPVLVFWNDLFAGYCWLNGVSESRAFGNFCFFRSVWGNTIDLGRHVLDYWFAVPGVNGEPLLNVLIGSTPEDNRRAVAFVRRLGFSVLGVIPHMVGDKPCVISYKTRIEHGR